MAAFPHRSVAGRWLALAAALTLLVVIAPRSARPAAAEVTRTVGPYRFTLGFATTPVYAEEPNAILIHAATADGAPVTGLDEVLLLNIGVQHQATESLALTPEPGQPGHYKVNIILRRAGIYTLVLFGTLDGQPIAERFVTEQDGLDKIITRGRQYPRGSAVVVVLTLGVYLVGLAYLVARGALRWRRETVARRSTGGARRL